MKSPLVYICILNWNQFDDTSECLDSLKCLNYPNFRVIVVDNDSRDGSCAKLQAKYPWATMLKNRKNLGFAAGNNVGIRYAMNEGAEYIFLLNSDAVADPDVLNDLVRMAESDERIGIVGPTIYRYPNTNIFWAAAMEKTVPNGKIFPHYLMRGKGETDTGQYSQVEDVDMINACALMIKRKTIQEVGLLDEKFFMYNEDSDWNDRTLAAGYRIVYVPGSKVWHKGSVAFGGECSPGSWFYTTRNELLYLRKRASWRMLPGIYMDYIKENFWFWKGFKEKGDEDSAEAIIDGIWAAIRNKGGERSTKAPQWFERVLNWKMKWDNRHRTPIITS